jgi:hypothetical protein
MVTSIHDSCSGDESSAKCRDHYEKRPPNLTLGIQNVQFSGKIDGEIEETSEGDWRRLVNS